MRMESGSWSSWVDSDHMERGSIWSSCLSWIEEQMGAGMRMSFMMTSICP